MFVQIVGGFSNDGDICASVYKIKADGGFDYLAWDDGLRSFEEAYACVVADSNLVKLAPLWEDTRYAGALASGFGVTLEFDSDANLLRWADSTDPEWFQAA